MAVKPIPLALLPYLRQAWWRKLEQQGTWHGANTTMVNMMAGLGLLGVFFTSLFAFTSLQDGATDRGLMVLEQCLNTVLMGWLIVPIMVGSTSAEGRGLQPVRMGQFPLRDRDLLAIGFMGRLVQPVYWILIASSLLVLWPLGAVAVPAYGIFAGIVFLVFSALLAWSIELFGSALFSSRHGREMLMLGVLILMIPLGMLIMGDFSMDDDLVTFALGGHSVLLINMEGTEGLLTKIDIISPASWVISAGTGDSFIMNILLLVALAGLSGVLAKVSLRRVMLHPPSSLSSGKGATKFIAAPGWLPVALGPLVIKEIRYLTRTLDHLMGVGMSVVGFAWIMIRPDHLNYVLTLGAANIILNEGAIPLNAFGLDGSGADRYRLLPLNGREILLTKNLAFFALAAMQLMPLALAGLLKGAWLLTLSTLLASGAVCLMVAVGGNYVSIQSPSPRAFFNFDSKEQSGGTLAMILSILIWAIPAGVFFGLYWLGMPAVVLGMVVLFGIALAIYRWRLPAAGVAFEENSESMRGRLGVE